MSLMFFFIPLHRNGPAPGKLNAALAARLTIRGRRLGRPLSECSATREIDDVAS